MNCMRGAAHRSPPLPPLPPSVPCLLLLVQTAEEEAAAAVSTPLRATILFLWSLLSQVMTAKTQPMKTAQAPKPPAAAMPSRTRLERPEDSLPPAGFKVQ